LPTTGETVEIESTAIDSAAIESAQIEPGGRVRSVAIDESRDETAPPASDIHRRSALHC
jgi:hypothetical protein